MLKKAQAGEAGPVGQVQKAAQAGKATQATPTPLPPRQPPLSVRSRLTPAEEAASSPQPVPLPSSVLHPDSLVPPKPTRLLRSFVAPSPPDAPVSVLPSRPPASSYFLPNPQITSASKAFADEVERLDKLHENGTMEKQELPEGFNPALYAAKALGIATLITLGTFSAGVYGLMRWFGVDDVSRRFLRFLLLAPRYLRGTDGSPRSSARNACNRCTTKPARLSRRTSTNHSLLGSARSFPRTARSQRSSTLGRGRRGGAVVLCVSQGEAGSGGRGGPVREAVGVG